MGMKFRSCSGTNMLCFVGLPHNTDFVGCFPTLDYSVFRAVACMEDVRDLQNPCSPLVLAKAAGLSLSNVICLDLPLNGTSTADSSVGFCFLCGCAVPTSFQILNSWHSPKYHPHPPRYCSVFFLLVKQWCLEANNGCSFHFIIKSLPLTMV